jgi:XisH protein
MPRRDLYHAAVRQALITDGWTITHDPYTLSFGARHGFVDLAAERAIAAERGGQKIAVEIKSFAGPSPVNDLGEAVGQYLLYRSWISRTDPDRELFLAVDPDTATVVFGDISAQVLLDDYAIKLLVVDTMQERIVAWRS